MQHYVDGLFASILLQFCILGGVPRTIRMFRTKQDPVELIDEIPIIWLVQYILVPLVIWSIDSLIRRRSLASWASGPFIAVFRYICLVGGLSMIAYTVLTNSWVRPQWENTLGKRLMEDNPNLDYKSIAATLALFGATCASMAWVAILFLKDVGYLMRGIFFRGYAKQKAE
ncbi:hypothetical protein FBU30_006612 [Linnemannia zychae]|nr:hypothetical protein FBU30_006612 [Linnemannia zychae]